jgi:hypothetical protein
MTGIYLFSLRATPGGRADSILLRYLTAVFAFELWWFHSYSNLLNVNERFGISLNFAGHNVAVRVVREYLNGVRLWASIPVGDDNPVHTNAALD